MNPIESIDVAQELNRHVRIVADPSLGFRVYYWGLNPRHFDNRLHAHSFFEVCYVRAGSGEYIEEGVRYPLAAGTLFCSVPGRVHQIRSQLGIDLAYVAFEVDELHSDPLSVSRYHRLYRSQHIVAAHATQTPSALLWQALIVCLESGDRDQVHPLVVQHTAWALLASFPAAFGTSPVIERHPEPEHEVSELMEGVASFIRDNLAHPIRHEDIAAQFHLSTRHLARLFHAEIGQTITEFLRDERLRFAQQLLRYSSFPIRRVAEASGFGSVQYFTDVFSKNVGLPPKRYRTQWAQRTLAVPLPQDGR